MKRALIILLVKILHFVGGLVGKGTSLPGSVALKLCPDILKRLRLPKPIIAVTGSNGKTGTVEMIARTMEKCGKRVAWNKGGSNQIEGVTTLLCCASNLKGIVDADAIVLESDERYARFTFSAITPTHFVITNLYRDQMTRNVHPEWIAELIGQAISPETTLVLNADDPLVAAFGKDRPGTVYFSMAENALSTKEPVGCYTQNAYCPICGAKLDFEYYQFGGMGKYACYECGFSAPPADVLVTSLDSENQTIQINGSEEIRLSFGGRFFVYNLTAAYTVCLQAGLEAEKVAAALSDHVQKTGRIARFMAGDTEGLMLTAKHENSVSYDQSLEYVAAVKEPSTVCILVDAISRKYFTGEVSWLWDVNFELLKQPQVKKILLCGRYAYDLATRFSLTKIAPDRIEIIPDLDEMGRRLNQCDTQKLFAITCFSDKDKIYDRVKVLDITAK